MWNPMLDFLSETYLLLLEHTELYPLPYWHGMQTAFHNSFMEYLSCCHNKECLSAGGDHIPIGGTLFSIALLWQQELTGCLSEGSSFPLWGANGTHPWRSFSKGELRATIGSFVDGKESVKVPDMRVSVAPISSSVVTVRGWLQKGMLGENLN